MRTWIIFLVINLAADSWAQSGLTAEYFNGIYLKDKVANRIEGKPHLNHYLKSPAPGVNQEFYSVRWTGSFFAPVTGEYRFFVTADDGVRVWIDDNLVVDAWQEQEATTYESAHFLDGQSYHKIKIEYFNTILHSVMMLAWENPEDEYTFMGSKRIQPRVPIPSKYLYPDNTFTPVKNDLVQTAGPVEKNTNGKQSKQQIESGEPTRDTTFMLNKPHTLKSVHFEQSKYEIGEEAFRELDKLIKYLKNNPHIKIKIIGHTDYAGDSVSNMELSQHRVRAVATYLSKHGISEERVTVFAMGSNSPIIVNEDLASRSKNRRVEFVLTE